LFTGGFVFRADTLPPQSSLGARSCRRGPSTATPRRDSPRASTYRRPSPRRLPSSEESCRRLLPSDLPRRPRCPCRAVSCRIRPRPRSIELDLDSRPESPAPSHASKLLVRSRVPTASRSGAPTVARGRASPSNASQLSSFTGSTILRADAPPTANALVMQPSCPPAQHALQLPLVFERLDSIDHRGTAGRRVLSYMPALDPRLRAYPFPHRPVPPASSPLSGIVRL